MAAGIVSFFKGLGKEPGTQSGEPAVLVEAEADKLPTFISLVCVDS